MSPTKRKRPRKTSLAVTTKRRGGAPPHSTRRATAPSPAVVRSHPARIVGVGASAGGLEAFSTVLRGLAADAGVAIVFVQHLAPQHESALVTLLSSQSELPVLQAADGQRVQRNHVYVIPPNTRMTIMKDTLLLSARPDDRSQFTPVDTFFCSLGRSSGPQAIGVILSGTASDGALGIREIKACGGVTIAQEPTSAKYDGMPHAAIATGAVDLVLPPQAIGPKLVELATHSSTQSADRSSQDLPLSEQQLDEVFELLRPASGVDFRHYKLPTIRRRLSRRMALHRLGDVDHYVRLLREDPTEVRSLYQDLLIHVTRFFREPDSFETLIGEVFPTLLEGRRAEGPIRAWVSGCATGEEAYSLAIALVEFLQRDHREAPIQIFATDVSETAVEQARTGVYPSSIEADLSADRLRRFFVKQDGGYRVTKTIRDLCVFARQDLTKDPPFSRLDLILCRNVLIYMDTVLQKKLLSVFHYALNPDGFLVLGQAETVGPLATLFTVVDKKYRIHRKKPAAIPPAMAFPVEHPAGVTTRKHVPPPRGTEKFLQAEVTRVLTDRYAPPGVVVDGDMQIVQFRGQTGAYLEPAPGEASLNLLKMAKEGLLYGLRSALTTARKTRDVVRKDGLQVKYGNAWRPVTIEVIPLGASGRLHYLVLFEEGAHRASSSAIKTTARPPAPLARREQKAQVEFLQRELAASREYLQSIIQELEAANEELLSANEEILSSNEELQSTNEELDTAKEELQSTNEELNTVNEELHGRNEELSRVNSDLLNLLGSVQIAIVIVSADLRIRRFTPMAEKVLNLIPADADRQIGHINPNIVGADLEALIAECIDTISPIEREVQDRQGHWYALRIRPYRSIENRIDGAVVALFDIDMPKRFEESMRSASAFVEGVLQASSDPMAIVDADLRLRMASQAFVDLLLPRDGWKERPLVDFTGDGTPLEELRALADDEPGASRQVSIATRATGGEHRALTLTARALSAFDAPADRVLLLTVAPAARTGARS
jgi:two-component system CheB/CheR fusion protein